MRTQPQTLCTQHTNNNVINRTLVEAYSFLTATTDSKSEIAAPYVGPLQWSYDLQRVEKVLKRINKPLKQYFSGQIYRR